MTTVIKYECDLCHQKYNSAEAALICEGRGVADSSAYPIGWVFEYHHNGYVGVFCIAEVTPSQMDIHGLDISLWAIRAPGFPKYSLDENLCGGTSYNKTDPESIAHFIKQHYITEEKTHTPEFKEMIDYLKSKDIAPFYYTPDGIKKTI